MCGNQICNDYSLFVDVIYLQTLLPVNTQVGNKILMTQIQVFHPTNLDNTFLENFMTVYF